MTLRYGILKISETPVPRPVQGASTPQLLMSYLASDQIPSVGEQTAAALVEYFGDSLLWVLNHAPERLSEAQGISPQEAMDIHHAWVSADPAVIA